MSDPTTPSGGPPAWDPSGRGAEGGRDDAPTQAHETYRPGAEAAGSGVGGYGSPGDPSLEPRSTPTSAPPGATPTGSSWQSVPVREPSWGPPQAALEPPGSPMVTAAGVVLTVLGVLLTLFGVLAIAAGGAISGVNFDQLGVPGVTGQSVARVLAILGAVVAGFGILEVLSGIGIFLRKAWARYLGLILTILGALLMLLSLLGNISSPAGTAQAQGQGGGLVLSALLFIAYAFVVYALARGGGAFRDRRAR